MSLIALWHAYGGLFQGVGVWATGWYSRLAVTKAQVRRDRLDAGAQALALAAALTAREQALTAALDTLRRREWALAGSVQDVYAEAIAARLIVHDQDATAGRPLRQFRPLPPYPFPAEVSQDATSPVSDAV